jgi:hypothetical protein
MGVKRTALAAVLIAALMGVFMILSVPCLLKHAQRFKPLTAAA